MTSKTWNGTGINTNYDDPTNWAPGGVPTTGDTAIFTANGANTSVDLAVNGLSVDEWLFSGGAYTINVSGAPFNLLGAGIQVTAGSALIEVLSGDDLVFKNSSSAGGATIEAQSGGTTTFQGNSDGATARLVADSGGVVDFIAGAGPGGIGNVAGSIEGAGTFHLGGRPLTVGGNNLSTTVSGTIDGTFGSSLTKVGAGTLTLSGSFLSTGAITIAGGTFDLTSGTPVSEFAFGANPHETLRIESAALPANNFAPLINSFGAGDTIDLPSLPFALGATATYNTSLQTLSVTNGSTTISFDSVAVAGAGTTFAVLSDHAGGSRVMLAIIATAKHELVDAKHHPPGQPSPTNGPDVILPLGANDTIKGLGGDDILVGGAKGVELVGGSGADTFLFQRISASPPKHPEIIWDFHHSQHDKIDLYDLRAFVPGHHPLVFIGAETFADYRDDPHHKMVFGMVRYSHGLVEVNVNHNLAPDFAIMMHNAPPLHGGPLGDFIL